LIVADFVAGFAYFKHAVWSKMFRMFPWAAVGIFAGYYVISLLKGRPDNAQILNQLIGWILVVLVCLSIWWRWFRKAPIDPDVPDEHGPAFEILVGIFAGFTTMVANAAGPIMILYLLRMRLPKLQFIGTCSCFFLVLNCFKVPFMIFNEMITVQTFQIDIAFFPFSLLGAFAGWALISWINQALFETLCLLLTLPAAIWLIKG
jgi:uncharacterized membrane protein YfcA